MWKPPTALLCFAVKSALDQSPYSLKSRIAVRLILKLKLSFISEIMVVSFDFDFDPSFSLHQVHHGRWAMFTWKPTTSTSLMNTQSSNPSSNLESCGYVSLTDATKAKGYSWSMHSVKWNPRNNAQQKQVGVSLKHSVSMKKKLSPTWQLWRHSCIIWPNECIFASRGVFDQVRHVYQGLLGVGQYILVKL